MTSTVDLQDVPETMLWNLHHRAAEASRPDAVLADPVAVELATRLEDQLTARFGAANSLLGQAQALRTLRFDREVTRFLTVHPRGTVAALGEGLETQSWRVDNGTARWVSVDLEEGIEVRRRLLPRADRRQLLAGSVLDPAWMEAVPPADGVLLTAQGLLMYLNPEAVHDLLRRSAERFPGASLVFDTVPVWFSERTKRGMRSGSGYRPPPMPWGVDAAGREALAEVPGIATLTGLAFPRGRGPLYGGLFPLLRRWRPRPLGYLAPWSVLRADFEAGQG